MEVGGIAGDQLRSFVERIERLEEEGRALGQDKKEVYAEAKGTGFDTNIIKMIVKRRRLGEGAVAEADELLEIYERAIKESEEGAAAPRARRGRRARDRGDAETVPPDATVQ
jgi:uncharacterized protein (UPF0335 family)